MIFTWWGHGNGKGHCDNVILRGLNSNCVISASANHGITACVTRDGEVFTWGFGSSGRLGHGDTTVEQRTPKRVEALIGVKAKQVSCGKYHNIVCTEDGKAFTFGDIEKEQLLLAQSDEELKTTTPTLVQALEGRHITQVQCGDEHTMALTSSGYVFSWCVGSNCLSDRRFSIPCLIEALREHNVVEISSYKEHSAVLVDNTNPSIILRQTQQVTFNNEEHSDVVFMVEDELLYANIDILSQKSDYFAAMFRSNMRESIEKVVEVPNCSKAAFLSVLQYLCMDGFAVSRIDQIVEVWELADIYHLEGMKRLCLGTLQRCLCHENVSEILQKIESLNCPCEELKRICYEHQN